MFWLLLLGCCWPTVSAPMALAAGITFGMVIGNPWGATTSTWSRRLLQASVVGLGFGMNLPELLKTGRDAFLYTALSISFTMFAGYLLGRIFKTPRRTATLISFGTAICGGSAIAAMAPVIKAEPEETGVALATVFTLNSIALLLFPPMGHLLAMGQRQFGLWSALAIHDTSSVVGAAAAYGGLALAIGTTVKLTRALWIMPSALLAAWVDQIGRKGQISDVHTWLCSRRHHQDGATPPVTAMGPVEQCGQTKPGGNLIPDRQRPDQRGAPQNRHQTAGPRDLALDNRFDHQRCSNHAWLDKLKIRSQTKRLPPFPGGSL